MKYFIVQLAALYATSQLIDGLYFDTIGSLIIATIVLTIVNAIIKPVLMFLTLPLNILTFGLFSFVISGFMLKLTSMVVDGMSVSGFWTATLAALILSVVNAVFSWLVGLNE